VPAASDPARALEAPAPAPGRARALDASLHRRLVWLAFFRVVTVTVLLGGTALVGWRAGGEIERGTRPLYATVVATYVASLAFALALRVRRWLGAVAYAQIVLDVGVAAVVVALTGATESVFVFMYALAIVNGTILLFRRGAVVSTALAVGAHWAVALSAAGPRLPPLPAVFAQGAALSAIAALTAWLAEQLRTADRRLAASEDELAAITALHESIVQSVTSGLVTLDDGGRVTLLNRAGELILGVSAAEVRGQPADRWFAQLRAPLSRAETDVVNARGERLRLGFTTFPLLGREGTAVGTAVIFQDLTRLRAMEEAVARSERLADLGRIAAGLAHELRNPLGAMTGAIELLRSGVELGPEEQRLMDIVLREGSRLERLIQEFLAFARPSSVRRRQVDLAAVCAEALDVFAHDPAAARVRVVRALTPAPVECDPDQLRQVLWNLLQNAAQAIAGQGGEGQVEVACAADGRGGAVLSVADDGPGVAAADADRIFLPFFTTKAQGTGLGLATVHRIVDAHGGQVTVEPRHPTGARFVVRLPAPPAAAPLRALG